MINKTLFHVTTPNKLAKYQISGRIIAPVRGFSTIEAAEKWARLTGRTMILKINATNCWKLPDHHNEFGTAWWTETDIKEWDISKVVINDRKQINSSISKS